MDVQQAAALRMFRQAHLGEVHGRQRGAVVAVADQLAGYLDADVVLRLQCAAADVRGEDDVVQADQWRHERLAVALGLDREHVDGGAGQMAALQRLGQRLDVDHAAARRIDQHGALAHFFQLLAAEHHLGGGRFRHVQRDYVGALQQLVQARHGMGIAHRQLRFDVVEQHAHAEAFGQHAGLRADVAVADDAQHLVARLVAAHRRLVPAADVALGVLVRDAAQQHDRFGHHQFSHAAGVGIRRVENRDAQLARLDQIHLVGADAEAAHRHQPLGVRKHVGGQLGARAQADDVRIGDALLQLGFGQGFRMQLDLAVACTAEIFDRGGAETFQQQHLDIFFRERGLHESPWGKWTSILCHEFVLLSQRSTGQPQPGLPRFR